MWLFSYELKLQHELAADAWVMKKGYNAGEYKQQLIRSTLGFELLPALNNFNKSFIKKRIQMLTTTKNERTVPYRYLVALVAVLFVSSFSLLELRATLTNDDPIYDIVEVMPDYPGGIPAMVTFLSDHLKYPELAAQNGVGGKVYVQFVVQEDGSVGQIQIMDTRVTVSGVSTQIVNEATQLLQTEAERVVASISGFTPGYQKGKAVKVRFTVPINFTF